MAVRISVAELLKALGETYRAIDIRTAATYQDGRWTNVLTVVRLTYEEPEEAAKRLQDFERRHGGPIQTKTLCITMGSRPFSEWAEFYQDHKNGVVRVGELRVNLRQQPDLNEHRDELRAYYGDLRPFDGQGWPVLQVHIGPHDSSALGDETLSKEISALGYSDAYEAINVFCEVNVSYGHSYGFDLYFSIPAFISVSDVRIVPRDRRVCVTILRHKTLSDVPGLVLLREQDYRTGAPSKARLVIDRFAPSGDGGSIERAIGFAEIPNIRVDDNDWVEARLTHPAIGEIHSFSRQVRFVIPAPEQNILFAALNHFCPEAQLRDLLVRPHGRKLRKVSESAAFELHVAWLLGLYGFSAIVLDEYEHLLAPETKISRGSVDILASRGRGDALLLVACTLGPPKEEDFNNLSNVRGILERGVFADTTARILPIVFTAAVDCPSYKELEGLLNFIPIIDADDLDALVVLLRFGQERQFLEFLGNPMLAQLRRPPGS